MTGLRRCPPRGLFIGPTCGRCIKVVRMGVCLPASAINRAATSIAAIATLCMAATDARAQKTQRVFYATAVENNKYTQQHLIEVGDVPGHYVRPASLQLADRRN